MTLSTVRLRRQGYVRCLRTSCRRKTRNVARVCSPRCAEMMQGQRADAATLPDGALPLQSTPHLFEDVDQHRRVWCRRQGQCIDYAERSGWDGFTCSMCPVVDEMTYDEKKTSASRMLAAVDVVHETQRLQRQKARA